MEKVVMEGLYPSLSYEKTNPISKPKQEQNSFASIFEQTLQSKSNSDASTVMDKSVSYERTSSIPKTQQEQDKPASILLDEISNKYNKMYTDNPDNDRPIMEKMYREIDELAKRYDVRNATAAEIQAIGISLSRAGKFSSDNHSAFDIGFEPSGDPPGTDDYYFATPADRNGRRNWIVEYEKRAERDLEYGMWQNHVDHLDIARVFRTFIPKEETVIDSNNKKAEQSLGYAPKSVANGNGKKAEENLVNMFWNYSHGVIQKSLEKTKNDEVLKAIPSKEEQEKEDDSKEETSILQSKKENEH